MKKLFYLPIILALAIMTSACSSKDKHNAGEKLKEINVSVMPGSSIFIAKNLGLFEKAFTSQGIKVNYSVCVSGPPMIEAFIANRIDIGLMGDQPALVAWAKDVDIKAVANFNNGSHYIGLCVVDTNKIKSLKDLKGKKIAASVGTITQHLLHLYLKDAGLTEKDVHIVNFSGADIIAAINSKQIDGAIMPEPYLTLFEHNNIAYKVADATGYKEFNNPLLVSGSLYRNHPDIVQKLVEIYYEANVYAIDHPEKAREIIIKESNYDLPIEVYRKIMRDVSKNLSFTNGSLTSYQQTLDYVKEERFISASFNKPISEFYDSTFVSKLYSQGKAKK